MAKRENPLKIPQNCFTNLGSRMKMKVRSGNLNYTTLMGFKNSRNWHYSAHTSTKVYRNVFVLVLNPNCHDNQSVKYLTKKIEFCLRQQ